MPPPPPHSIKFSIKITCNKSREILYQNSSKFCCSSCVKRDKDNLMFHLRNDLFYMKWEYKICWLTLNIYHQLQRNILFLIQFRFFLLQIYCLTLQIYKLNTVIKFQQRRYNSIVKSHLAANFWTFSSQTPSQNSKKLEQITNKQICHRVCPYSHNKIECEDVWYSSK